MVILVKDGVGIILRSAPVSLTIHTSYSLNYVTPFKEFRLQLISMHYKAWFGLSAVLRNGLRKGMSLQ